MFVFIKGRVRRGIACHLAAVDTVSLRLATCASNRYDVQSSEVLSNLLQRCLEGVHEAIWFHLNVKGDKRTDINAMTGAKAWARLESLIKSFLGNVLSTLSLLAGCSSDGVCVCACVRGCGSAACV